MPSSSQRRTPLAGVLLILVDLLGAPGVLTFTAAAQRVDLDAGPGDRSGLPVVLLIGDSIAVGYAPTVRKLLEGKANVHRLAIGGGSTRDGLRMIDGALGQAKWDVIHFNWGLNDLEREQGRNRVPVDQYRKNIEDIVRRLEKTGARLIWATTTPVPEGRVSSPRDFRDVPVYNLMALQVINEHHIPVNDLYRFALPRLGALQSKEDVHFTKNGYAVLAEEVVKHILRVFSAP